MPRLLFTTLPSNDLGLLTRSLPIAEQLAKNRFEIAFSSPTKAPNRLISDAGFESCQTGLFTGTPSVIIPTFSERESNARRIAALGAGEIIIPFTNQAGHKQIDLDEFRSKATLVLSTNRYKKNAEKYQELLKSYGGTKHAVSLIMKFLEHK